jgi:protein-tyrosine phosphatase
MTPRPHDLEMMPKKFHHLLPPSIGTNTLNKAISKANIDIVKLIVDKVDVKLDIYTLDYAVLTKSADIVEYVLQLGTKPNIQTLQKAIKSESPAIIKLVIDSGVKLPKRNQDESLPMYRRNPELYLAGKTKNSEIIKLIVDFVNEQDTLDALTAYNKNWYKKSQANIVGPEEHGQHYFSVGHDYLEHESEIWVWDKGSLYTDSGNNSHGRFAKQLEDSGQIEKQDTGLTRYYGRFDNTNGEKMVSIRSNGRFINQISPRLIKDLEAEYGKDIDVHPF